jgi:hypothetical protein
MPGTRANNWAETKGDLDYLEVSPSAKQASSPIYRGSSGAGSTFGPSPSAAKAKKKGGKKKSKE